MFQWTWLTLLAVTSVKTDGTINDSPQYSIKRISEEPLVYSMEMPTLQKPPTLESFPKQSHLKREKRHLHTQETPAISIPQAVRQRRCHAAERHVQNFRNQPSVLDESSSIEQPDTTKRDTKSAYGHHLLHPTLPTTYAAPKKDYNALKDYLNLMHQMQRDAYNTLQNKLKETITKTKQPWRDDHSTRLEKPFSGTDPLWSTHNHVSSANFPSYDSGPKWHSPPLGVATHEPKVLNEVQPTSHYLGTLPIGSDVGVKAGLENMALGTGKESQAVGTLANPDQNHLNYMDTAEQHPMKPLGILPVSNQNHLNYIGSEQGQSEPAGALPNPNQNHLNYIGSEQGQREPGETLPNPNQNHLNYIGTDQGQREPEETLQNPNQNHLSYIGTEGNRKHAEALPNPNQNHLNYIGTEQGQRETEETLQNPNKNHLSYIGTEPEDRRHAETLPNPNQNHLNYIGTEQGQREPEETLQNPNKNHLSYIGTEGHRKHAEALPNPNQNHLNYIGTQLSPLHEALPVKNQDSKNYAGAKHTNSKPLEELVNPNQDRLSYIDSENAQNKPKEALPNSDQNHLSYAHAKNTQSKPVEVLLNPSSDHLDYNEKRFEKHPIPSQDGFSSMNVQTNLPTPILPTVIVSNVDHNLPTPSTSHQVKIPEKIENHVKGGNFTLEVVPNEEEHTTENVPFLQSPAAITEKPETRTPQQVAPTRPVKTPQSHVIKLQKHSKNLVEKMKNLNDRKKDLDEMVASIIKMEQTSPTTDPGAQADLQKIMDSIQAYNEDHKNMEQSQSPTTETQYPQSIETPRIQNAGTRVVQALYAGKTEERENSADKEISEWPVERTRARKFPTNGRIHPRTESFPSQPEFSQNQPTHWSQNIQQAVPKWSLNQQQTVENSRPEKSKLSRKLQKEQPPRGTTSPYDVILLKDKTKMTDTPHKPAKKHDYPLKFLRQTVKPEEPYQIVEETVEPSSTESPEERLIKLLASSAEPEVIEEIRHEMKELKRYFSEEETTTTVRPSVESKPEEPTNPNMISTKDKIIIPFDHQHPKIIMIDPNELHSQQFGETPSQKNQLGAPVFSFAGGDPFQHDDLAKSAPETGSSEEDEEGEDYHEEEKSSHGSLPKNFPWNLYYPNIGTPLNRTQTNNKSELQRNPDVTRQAPITEAARKNFEVYQQKAAENYDRLLREREDRLKNLRESYKKPKSWSKNPAGKAYPTKTPSRLPTEQPFSQNFPQYARNYPYDPSMVQGSPIESHHQAQHVESHLPEKRSCNCGNIDPIEPQEKLTLPSNSLSDCPCRHSKPSQAIRNDLSDYSTEQRKKSDKKEKTAPVVAENCSSDESLPVFVESKKPSCGCHDCSESDEVPKSRRTCACGRDHDDDDDDDDDCGPCNALRSPRSHAEPNKYEILNNVLLWFKRFAKKDLGS